jgi:hypothetical protein
VVVTIVVSERQVPVTSPGLSVGRRARQPRDAEFLSMNVAKRQIELQAKRKER